MNSRVRSLSGSTNNSSNICEAGRFRYPSSVAKSLLMLEAYSGRGVLSPQAAAAF